MRDYIFKPNSRSRFDCVLVAGVGSAWGQGYWGLGIGIILVGAVIAALGQRS